MGFFFPRDSQTWSLTGAGTAGSSSWDWGKESKNHRCETGAEMPHPMGACGRVGLRSRGFGVSLGKCGPGHTEMPPAAAAPGSCGRRGARGRGAASSKPSSVSCSTYENKQKEGKSYPVTHSQGSEAAPPRVCWFARPPAAQPEHPETGAGGGRGL